MNEEKSPNGTLEVIQHIIKHWSQLKVAYIIDHCDFLLTLVPNDPLNQLYTVSNVAREGTEWLVEGNEIVQSHSSSPRRDVTLLYKKTARPDTTQALPPPEFEQQRCTSIL